MQIAKNKTYNTFFNWINRSDNANSLPKHFHKTLDNGMQIVVIPLANESGVITSDIYYKVGSQNEVLGKTGMAHMLEHLSFKSTKNLSEGEFDTIVKKRRGSKQCFYWF